MRKYTDEELIDGLRHRRSGCIDYLYQEYFPIIRHHLTRNSGNLQDMEDLFQDTIIVLYKRCLEEPFSLGCSFKTYFVSVSKNLWMQRLDYKFRLLYQADYEVHEPRICYSEEEQEREAEKLEMERLFYDKMMELPGDCRQILQLYCLKVPYKEIATLLHLKDEVYVKTRKYFCKNLLRKKILNDPECRQFLSYD
ncbi:MAG: RNA polymerase sigma factor [Bacteroidales bacterium]